MAATGESPVQCVNPLDDPQWDDAVARLPGATFFHSSAWTRVLQETYGFRPRYFTTRAMAGGLATVVPLMEVESWLTGRRGLSLPFTDECAPIASEPAQLQSTLDAITAEARARRWRYWEIRSSVPALTRIASSSYFGHELALGSDIARLFAHCDSAARRGVRKAEEARISITFAHDLASTHAFHRLLCQTRRRLGVPPQPLRFFENIQRHILAPRRGCIVLARQGDRPIAGAVFFHFGSSALFKFGASDESFQQLRPNNLVMWRAIEWHARAGFHTVAFGRTSMSNEGLRRFKLAWGTTERRIAYTRFNPRTAACEQAPDRASGWHNKIFRLLPLAVARAVGTAAYKHVA